MLSLTDIRSRFANLNKSEKIHWSAFIVILFFGAFLRLYDLGGPPIWYDEAWRALIVSSDNFGKAMFNAPGPVPVFFLLLPRFLVSIFGSTEFILRFPGAIFGIASVILVYFLVKKISGTLPALIAMFLISFQPMFIRYSREFKQYPYDVFFALLAVFLVEGFFDEDGSLRFGWPRFIAFAVFCLAGMFFSFNLLFIYPAMFLVLLYASRKNKISFKAFSALAALTFTFLVGYYKISLVHQVHEKIANNLMLKGYLINPALSLFDNLFWYFNKTVMMFQLYVYNPYGALSIENVAFTLITVMTVFLILAGSYSLHRRRKLRLITIFLSPLLLLMFFSLFGLCSYGGVRMNMFYFSFPVMLLSMGIAHVYWGMAKSRQNPSFIIGGLLVFLSVFFPLKYIETVVYPRYDNDLRPALLEVFRSAKENDSIITFGPTRPALNYYYFHYSPYKSFGKVISRKKIYHVPEKGNDFSRDAIADLFKTNKRVWFIATHVNKEKKLFLKQVLANNGRLASEGGRIICFDAKQTYSGLYLSNYLK